MKKYKVRVSIPTALHAVYEVAAETEQEALQEAKEIFKVENDTWIEPQAQLVAMQ